MSTPIEITLNGYLSALPNEATLSVVREAMRQLGEIPGISVRITSYENIPGWRFYISFAWDGRKFANVVYGYGGGEISSRDNSLCECKEQGMLAKRIFLKFEPEPLRQKLAELLLAVVQKEKSRLQEICEKLTQKPQESRIGHSGGGTGN